LPAQTIDEVITQLSDIIDRSRSESSRLGYFVTLYRPGLLAIRLRESNDVARVIDPLS